jgi:putative hydrolase of the HAD superfamily
VTRRGAVLFDLDGTLIDYEGCVREALESLWQRLAPGARFDRSSFLGTYHRVHRADEAAQLAGRMSTAALLDRGDRFLRVLEALGSPDPALARSLGEDYERARRELTRLFPGAIDTLGWLRSSGDLWLAVVTEGIGLNQRRQLERLEVAPLLDDILVSREVGLHKPDPALVGLALARSGTEASRAVFVGDRPLWDLAPAKAVGLQTVFLRSERYAHELAASPGCADAVVADHQALRDWLQGWHARLT